MHNREHLIEQHVLEYNTKLRHIDELFEKADDLVESGAGSTELRDQLVALRHDRDQLADYLKTFKHKTPEQLEQEKLAQEGPMVLWRVVAQKLEQLVNR